MSVSNELTEEKKNELISRGLAARKKLREQKKRFEEGVNYDLPKKCVQKYATELGLTDEQANKMLEKFIVEEEATIQGFALNETEIGNMLSSLGYREAEQISDVKAETKKEEVEIDESLNIVEKYEKMITTLEKMIDELTKGMNELEAYIKDMGKKLNFDASKVLDKDKTKEVSNDNTHNITK